MTYGDRAGEGHNSQDSGSSKRLAGTTVRAYCPATLHCS